MTYSLSDIKAFCSMITWSNAFTLAQQGHVRSCMVRSDSHLLLHIYTTVIGSHGDEYLQNIELYRTYGKLKVQGACSCPVGYNCKHVMAALIAYKSGLSKPDPKQELALWAKSLQKPSDVPDEDQFVLYRLFSSTRGDAVSLYRTKMGKNGRPNKGAQLRAQSVFAGHGITRHSYYDDADMHILALLSSMCHSWNYTITLEGTLGWEALMRMMETGRCYLGEQSEVLQYSTAPYALDISYQSSDLEHFKIALNLPEHAHLLPTKPVALIDTHKNMLYPLKSDIDFALISKLLKAPKLPNTLLNDTYEALSPMIPLPVPAGYVTRTLTCKPVAVVVIQKEHHEAQQLRTLRLCLRYETYRLDYGSDETIALIDGARVEILRDTSMEQAFMQRLEALGLVHSRGAFMKPQTAMNTQEELQFWNRFLAYDLAQLEAEGWEIEFEESFQLKFVNAETIEIDAEESNAWFSLSFDIVIDGQKRPLLPLITSILQQYDAIDALPEQLSLELEENSYVTLSTRQFDPVLKTLFELFDRADAEGKVALQPFESHLVDDVDTLWKGSRELLELSRKLRHFKAIEPVTPPKALQATLRSYQQEGLDWLGFLHTFGFGGILADDMGLGKTIQTLAHLSRLKEEEALKHPSLVIVPTSLLANWRNECERFTPNLKLIVMHGAERSAYFETLSSYDLVVTTYALAMRDADILGTYTFEYIILDEAQKIKNHTTKLSQSIRALKSRHRLALSGTPIENHLGELWSIFAFLMPGFLHGLTLWRSYYQNPIEKEHDLARQQKLNRRIRPFVLRRTKESVALELPPKTEIVKYTQFESRQAKLYESIRLSMEKKVREAIASKGVSRSHITILDALLKLRQVCCDPSLLDLKEAKKVKESAKMELLFDLLDELLQEGRKILLFSQFTSMLALIEAELKSRRIDYALLTGSTIKREEQIARFEKGDVDLFLISLKAGGVGLNLIAADTVIHYDPWWNPASENQATDRAHRIGQDKPVFVYKLIVENSIEQKILKLQERKRSLQNAIYEEEGGGMKLDETMLLEILNA